MGKLRFYFFGRKTYLRLTPLEFPASVVIADEENEDI